MSVDVTNETQWVIDPKVFSDLGIWVLDQMRVSTQSDLTIMFVDPDPIAELHMRWMNLEGPTDVMSFPMDELRPGDGKTVMEGVLGDIVICPWVAAQQAAAAGHSTMQEMLLLTIHGILHLLGYDHGPVRRRARCRPRPRFQISSQINHTKSGLFDTVQGHSRTPKNHYGVFQYHADRHHRHSCTRGGPVRLALADHGRR